MTSAPKGAVQQRNLPVKGGNHCKYIPKLVGPVATGVLDPTGVITQRESVISAVDAHKECDRRRPGWMKVELQTS